MNVTRGCIVLLLLLVVVVVVVIGSCLFVAMSCVLFGDRHFHVALRELVAQAVLADPWKYVIISFCFRIDDTMVFIWPCCGYRSVMHRGSVTP